MVCDIFLFMMDSLPQRFIILGVVIAVLGLIAAGYFFLQYSKAQKQIQDLKTNPANTQQVANDEIKLLVDQVGKLIELPAGEQPSVATITDVEKLKEQVFFQKAKNGDKIIIYPNAKKAILYDPVAGKVIDVAPVSIGTSSAQVATPETAKVLKIALRNGTKTVGLTTRLEPSVKKAAPSAEIVSKENAEVNTYDKTLVVVINGLVQKEAETLAKDLKSQVSSLPAGEEEDKEADVMIIFGRDKI